MNEDINELIKKAVDDKEFPEIVYKYRSFNDHTEEIFKNNQMYFPAPIDFNDPFDFKIRDGGVYSTDDIFSSFLIHGNLQNKYPINEIHKKADILSNDQELFLECIENVKNDFAKKMGVMCLSKIHDSILMWSHYTDCHKGFVLGFETKKDPDFFKQSFQVIYSKDYPVFSILKDDDQICIDFWVRTKSIEWEYEKEFRVIKSPCGYYVFNKETLHSVYLGCKISDENKKNILRWLKEYGYTNTKVYQGKTSGQKFELEFDEIE